MKSTRGDAGITTIVVIAIVGVAAWLGPKIFGDSKRAKQSTEATAKVEDAQKAVRDAEAHNAAVAAAGIVSIGKAAGDLPPSPASDYIDEEVTAVLSKLPTPDPQGLIDAEKRRTAFMQGQRDLARALFAEEHARTAKLQEVIAEKDAALAKAFEERRAVDLELEKTAAAALVQYRQKLVLCVVAVVLAGLWVYAKLSGLSISSLGRIAADIRAGEQPMAVLNRYVPERLKEKVYRKAQLYSDLPDNSAPVKE